jgi:hypothetical protein
LTTTKASVLLLHLTLAADDSDATQAQDIGSSSMRRQDSSTSMSTVNIGRGSGDGGASFSFAGQAGGHVADDAIDDISLSGASVTIGSAIAGGDAASVADSASSMPVAAQVSCVVLQV